ncbi:hypothetical protein L2E82_25323 [Cichorium intybus]|uniref:Uncharacterized protein n=1 Tax=Cichorium intybus TaxID=13427 RepID=A0ACB9E3K7_CICIN|nr:hypothetical protein L2E82_25323 [Cichorium intybus]
MKTINQQLDPRLSIRKYDTIDDIVPLRSQQSVFKTSRFHILSSLYHRYSPAIASVTFTSTRFIVNTPAVQFPFLLFEYTNNGGENLTLGFVDDQIALSIVSIPIPKKHKLIHPPNLEMEKKSEAKIPYNILLVFLGLKQALTTNPGYNRRVSECQEAVKILLKASGKNVEPILFIILRNVEQEEYEAHKDSKHGILENLRYLENLSQLPD